MKQCSCHPANCWGCSTRSTDKPNNVLTDYDVASAQISIERANKLEAKVPLDTPLERIREHIERLNLEEYPGRYSPERDCLFACLKIAREGTTSVSSEHSITNGGTLIDGSKVNDGPNEVVRTASDAYDAFMGSYCLHTDRFGHSCDCCDRTFRLLAGLVK